MPPTYKVLEVSPVDELSLEKAVNQTVAEGWDLDSVQFVKSDASKRPAMAFLFFIRKPEDRDTEDEGAPGDE